MWELGNWGMWELVNVRIGELVNVGIGELVNVRIGEWGNVGISEGRNGGRRRPIDIENTKETGGEGSNLLYYECNRDVRKDVSAFLWI